MSPRHALTDHPCTEASLAAWIIGIWCRVHYPFYLAWNSGGLEC